MIFAVLTSRQSVDKHGQNISVIEEAYILYFKRLGIQPLVLPSFSDYECIRELPVGLIVLVGGGDAPREYFESDIDEIVQLQRNALEKKLIDFALRNKIPLLGICRGMQVLNGFFGGHITRSYESRAEVGKEHKVNTFDGRSLFVNSFHQDVIRNEHLSNAFSVVAMHENDVFVEAMVNEERKILGIQWHPERMNDDQQSKAYTDYLIKHFLLGEE